MKFIVPLLRGLMADLCLVVLLSTSAWAQAPSWQAAMGGGGGGAVKEIATDNTGNVYLLGSFTSSAFTFGGLTFQNGDTHAPGPEIFLIKWNTATNSVAWGLQSRGMGGSIEPTGVAVAGANVYVSGLIDGSRSFAGARLVGGQTHFVAKLTDAGTSASYTWTQYVTRVSNYSLTPTGKKSALAVSGANLYMTGQFKGTVSLGTINLVSNGGGLAGVDGFVAKLVDAGSTGSFVWAQSFGGTGDEVSQSIAISGTDIYVGGRFDGTAVLGTTNLVSAGGRDGFVAKFVDAGSIGGFAWARSLGGTANDEVVSVAANGSGAYAAGTFSGTASTGAGNLVSAGADDGFVSKLADTDGHFIWSKTLGGTGYESMGAVTLLGNGVYATGGFEGTASFGAIGLTTSGQSDVFVTRLTDSGTASAYDWAQNAVGTGRELGSCISVTQAGVFYVGGSCGSATTFGTVVVPAAGAFFASSTDARALATKAENPLAAWYLYPNPAHGRIAVQLPAVSGTTTATLTVFDALGRSLRTQTASTNAKAELNLTGLAPGFYVVQAVVGDFAVTRRLVLE